MQKEAEKNAMLDKLVLEMSLKPGKTTSAAAKAKAQSAKASSAHKDHAAEQGSPASTAAFVSLAKSDHSTVKASSPVKGPSDSALPTPAAEPDLAHGAKTGILTFKTSSAADVKHKRDRKAFKKSAEEATRQRGLTVVSVEWLDDRAGIRVHWSRTVENDEEDELDDSSILGGPEEAASGSNGADKEAETGTVEPGDQMEGADEAGQTVDAGTFPEEAAPADGPDDGPLLTEHRDLPAFSQADYDNLFEREEAVPPNKAWARIANDVSLLLYAVEEPLDDDDEKKMRVREHLEAITAMVDAVGVPEDGEVDAGGLKGKGRPQANRGSDDDVGNKDDKDVDIVIEGSDD
jgi:hypothetical protein